MRPRPPTHPFFPTFALPAWLRDTIVQASFNRGAPHDMAATVALAVISAATGGAIGVRTPDERDINAEMYFLYVGESGSGKTPMYTLLAQALDEHDRQADQRYKADMEGYDAKLDIWNAVMHGLRRRMTAATTKGQPTGETERAIVEHAARKPIAPRSTQLVIEDSSKKAMYEHLEGKDRCAAVLAHEGAATLNSSFVADKAAPDAFFDGATSRLSRTHRDILVQRPHVTFLAMVQPKVMSTYMKEHGEAATDCGLLPRINVSYPSRQFSNGFTPSGSPEWDHVEAFHERMRSLLRSSPYGNPDAARPRVILELDDAATAHWRVCARQAEINKQPGNCWHGIPAWATKGLENIVRLAALLHHASGLQGRISLATIQSAAAVIDHYMREAVRLFHTDPAQMELEEDCDDLERYIRGKVAQGFARLLHRDIHRNGRVRDKRRYGAALDQLIAARKAWITIEPNKSRMVNFNLQYFLTLPLP